MSSARIVLNSQNSSKSLNNDTASTSKAGGSRWLKLPNLLNFGNAKGITAEVPIITDKELKRLKELKFNFLDRMHLVKVWKSMIGKQVYKLRYSKFLAFFHFKNEPWIRRMFDIMNENLSGSVSFLEFIIFISKYLVIDRATTEEFCFRMISRRGSSYNPKYSVLDFEDVVNFVTFRYAELNTLPAQRRNALEVFTYMDSDGDGGLDLSEFHDFCSQNAVFLKVSHPIQNHMRKCLFGLEFWVSKSRRVKMSQATGMDVLTLPHRINQASELFTVLHIKDPVVDSHGNPLKTPDARSMYNNIASDANTLMSSPSPSVRFTPSSLSHRQAPPIGMLSRLASARLPRLTSDVSSKSNPSSPISALSPPTFFPPEEVEEEVQDDNLDNHRAMFHQLSMRNLSTANSSLTGVSHEEMEEEMSFYKGEFTMAGIPGTTFAKDFPEVIRRRNEKRLERKRSKSRKNRQLDSLSTQQYDRLITACSDLMYSRRDLRIAFKQWLLATGVTPSAASVGTTEGSSQRVRRGGLVPAELASQNSDRVNSSDPADCNYNVIMIGGLGGGSLVSALTEIPLVAVQQSDGFVREDEELSADGDDQFNHLPAHFAPPVTSSTGPPRKKCSKKSGGSRVHSKIVLTNQRQQQQSEDNCVSEYVKHYMDHMHRVEWQVPRLEKLSVYRAELTTAQQL